MPHSKLKGGQRDAAENMPNCDTYIEVHSDIEWRTGMSKPYISPDPARQLKRKGGILTSTTSKKLNPSTEM